MSLRKWVVRGLVAMVLVGCLGAGVVYQQWTNPAAVRQQVVDMLEKQLPGATITLGGARLRLFGGVILTELRIFQHGAGRGSPEDEAEAGQAEVVHIAQATVYPNKEKLLDGQFPVQRIEMHRPLIHIVRNKDGKWNVEGLTGNSDPSLPLPTFVIDKATLIVEDRYAGHAVWELRDLDMTLTSDAPNCLTISGACQSETMGEMRVHGTLNRATNASTLSFRTSGLCISKELVHYVASLVPNQQLDGLQMEGKADIDATVAFQPGATPALTHDVHFLLRQTSIDHPKLVPLHNLTASIRCTTDKLTLENLKAAAGSGKIECKGWADPAEPEKTFAGQLTASYLPVTYDLVERLPERLRERGLKLLNLFQPAGCAKVQVQAESQKGKLVRAFCTIEPDDASICCEKFKYPLDHLSGIIDFDCLKYESKFEVVGYSGKQPITVRGTWKGNRPDATATIEIAGQDIPIDEKLLSALPGDKTKGVGIQNLAASFHPEGKGSFQATMRLVPGTMEFQNTYRMHFQESSVKWDEFRYPLENIGGDLVVYPRSPEGFEQFEFTNFKGTHNGGDVYVRGSTLPREGGKNDGKLVVEIAGRDVCLDSDLKHALSKFDGLTDTWDKFAPAGRLNFQAKVERLPGQNRELMDIDLGVDVAGCAIKPSFFPYEFHDVACQFHYRKKKLELTHFTASHNSDQFSIAKGTVDLLDNRGFFAQLEDIRANPLLANEDLLRALPHGLLTIAEGMHLKDQLVAMQIATLVVSQSADAHKPPEVFWDGSMKVRDAKLAAGIELNHVTATVACRGLHNGKNLVGLGGNAYLNEATILGQPFKEVRSHFFVPETAPDEVHFNLDAPIFDGKVSGQGRVQFGSGERALRFYELDLTASQVQLEEFGRHNLGSKQQLAGILAGRLHLEGRGPTREDLEGNGSIDVPYSPTTRLLNIPLLLDLLKFLGLRWPDRTFFEEAHADFAIHGDRVAIGKLDLQGNAVTLHGGGGVNLDGSDLQLDMYSTWGRAEQMLPSVVREFPLAISKQLLKIEVRGKVGGKEGDLKFSKRLVPGLTEPLMEMSNSVFGANNR
jgi:hypothetical protein